MASKGLTECWREAMAAKPSGWELRGLVLGPREADPVIQGRSWFAWAVGPDGRRASGKGESPEDALLALTVQLRELR
jgi:hypothetical protein